MEAALELAHVTKRFGALTAVDDVSFRLERGGFLGLVGRNGAGKSTTLKMATALMAPTSGKLKVLGYDVQADGLEVKRRIGAMPEDMALLEMLTGPQYLRFVGRMHGLGDQVIDARRDELFSLLELAPQPRALIADYSFGMKKKVALSAALLHGPQLVFLDEPFEGIDVLAAGVIRELLSELSRRGVTLLLTTHVLEIADRLATHAGVIRAGAVVDEGSVDELKARHGCPSLEAVFEKLIGVPVARHAALSFYRGSGS